jgi:hypothetical protein
MYNSKLNKQDPILTAPAEQNGNRRLNGIENPVLSDAVQNDK